MSPRYARYAVIIIHLVFFSIMNAACSHTPENEEYKESHLLSPLVIPEGLDPPEISNLMLIPGVPARGGGEDIPLSELLIPPTFIPAEEAAVSGSETEPDKERPPSP